MLALEVEYLMGRVLASKHDDRRSVEWPPHPSRLFAALVAAYKECNLDDTARTALEWLEGQSPPAIFANPPDSEGWERDVHNIFVPINDSNDQFKKKKDGKISKFPKIMEGINIARARNERWFPAFTPHDQHIWFICNDADESNKHVPMLQHIAENVTYLGHSMSPVRLRLSNSPPEPTLSPNNGGSIYLRTTGKGRLLHLESVHQLRQENESIQPRLGKVTPYQITDESEDKPRSLFSHGFAFEQMGGPSIPLESTAKLINAVRKATLALCEQPVPEILSGYTQEGKPSHLPHLAITPLANVGHRHADGRILGVSFWLPGSANFEEYEQLETVLANLTEINLGTMGNWQLKQDFGDTPKKSLWLNRYRTASVSWTSITPVIFGKFPKKSQIGPGRNGGKIFAEMCQMIGLPEPMEVRLDYTSAYHGAPKSTDYQIRPPQADGRLMAHVFIRFAEPVHGPIILGAGRFVGFGLCRPWYPRRQNEA